LKYVNPRAILGAATVLLLGCLVPGSGSVHYESTQPSADASWVYYPQSDVYYSVNLKSYYYQGGGRWQYARELPRGHRGRVGNVVTVSYVGPRPYEYHQDHRSGRPGPRNSSRPSSAHGDAGRGGSNDHGGNKDRGGNSRGGRSSRGGGDNHGGGSHGGGNGHR
jgi:uncharacterized membrane protein YgcG